LAHFVNLTFHYFVGFLGAGKTTLLKHILENKAGLKVAVIVNDMASLNIDASLIEMSGLIQAKEEIVHMQNGCICCTLRADLVREITKIAEEQMFDYIVIESTGISNPMEVAESFLLDMETMNLPDKDDAKARPLSSVATLDTCITVVDAFELNLNLSSIESLGQKFNEVSKNSNSDWQLKL
jgi:G3E family GTPase